MAFAFDQVPAVLGTLFVSVSNKTIIREIIRILNHDCAKVTAKGLNYGDLKLAKRTLVSYVFNTMNRKINLKRKPL